MCRAWSPPGSSPRSSTSPSYSASRAGRNLAPVTMGTRERADVILAPFEMALREGRPRSVMHAYTDTDGIPSAADQELLTGLLRDTWGFGGTVVADYFGIAFLKLLHGVAGSWDEAAGLALASGVDVELPTVKTFGQPLLDAVEAGTVPEELIDRALRRVLVQKAQLGLLDPGWNPLPQAISGAKLSDPEALRGSVDLDPRPTGGWRASWQSRQSCCCAMTARCRSAAPAGSR
ncbi:glycoside hydrolase family 3 N-terminal domain-containing protein [Streptomyces lasalocidi]